MDRAILRPPSELLPTVVEEYTEQAPERDQAHVRHDWRNEAVFYDPRRDEFGKAIAPYVLVHGDGNHEGASNWFVGVDRVCSGYGRNSRDLNTSAGVADDHDCFPRPLLLVSGSKL